MAVTVLNTGRCRNSFLNSCLRELFILPLFTNSKFVLFTFLVSQIAMQTFFRAGTRTTLREELYFLAHAQHFNLQAVPVPDDMFQFDNDF